MTDTETGVQQIRNLLLWLSDSNWRWFGLYVFAVWLVLMPAAVAFRHSWREGYAEPPSRATFALVETMANSLLIVSIVFVALAIGAPVYRWRRRHR